MTVVPFRVEHYEQLDAVAKPVLTSGEVVALERAPSWTALAGNQVVACAGVVKMWPGRYTAWAFLGDASRGYMREITKAVRAFLDMLDARRVELSVELGFKQGHQWARMLGFTLETPVMPAYGVGGEPHAMYVKLKEG